MNGYVIISSGRDVCKTIENNIGNIPRTRIYETYSEAVKRKKELLSYRSSYSKAIGMTEIILKVKDNKIIGK